MINLDKHILEEVQTILRNHVSDCEVRAFGSRVDGSAQKYSDLDLAIEGNHPLDPHTLHNLKDAFSESDLPIMVDLLDWHSLSENFKRKVMQLHEIIQIG